MAEFYLVPAQVVDNVEVQSRRSSVRLPHGRRAGLVVAALIAPLRRVAACAVALAACGAVLAAQNPPDFARQLERQAETDRTWHTASEGAMRMEKITYRSRVDKLEIPAFLFTPLPPRGPRTSPALVWVHPDIRGHLYEYYIPYVREAVSRGYVVIAPEYRGSIGYGREFYDAIDYGGAEVDDVITAAAYLKANVPQVNPDKIRIIGWSHGGMITVLAVTREPALFAAATAMVPVTNLFQRLAWKGVERQHEMIDPANRFGGCPPSAARCRSARRCIR